MPTVTVRHDAPGRAFQVRRRAPDGVPAIVAVLPKGGADGRHAAQPEQYEPGQALGQRLFDLVHQ